MTSPGRAKPRKENYFVQIENADASPVFLNVSQQLGKPCGFTKPLATTMLRVRDDAILFSALKLSKNLRERLLAEPLQMKPGPLQRLERRVATAEPLTTEQLLVQVDDGDLVPLLISRDENNVVSLEFAGDGEEPSFTLPKKPLALTLYMKSPRTARAIVVGWQGYQGKPESLESIVRAAAQALNHLSGLAEFALLAGIAQVKVPASPARFQIAAPTRKASDLVEYGVPVRLWTDDATPALVGAGTVAVSVDLDNANPSTSQLLFHSTPSADIAESFEPYKLTFDRALTAAHQEHFDDQELSELVFSIVLGELSDGDLGRLRDAGATITGFDLTPRQFVKYVPNA